MQDRFPDAEIVPVSAKEPEYGRFAWCYSRPVARVPFLLRDSQVTDRSERFLVSEIIREKIMRQMGEEVPML